MQFVEARQISERFMVTFNMLNDYFITCHGMMRGKLRVTEVRYITHHGYIYLITGRPKKSYLAKTGQKIRRVCESLYFHLSLFSL